MVQRCTPEEIVLWLPCQAGRIHQSNSKEVCPIQRANLLQGLINLLPGIQELFPFEVNLPRRSLPAHLDPPEGPDIQEPLDPAATIVADTD